MPGGLFFHVLPDTSRGRHGDTALMELYKLLSKNYDRLFPVADREIAFLEAHVSGKARLLDIGCGTGGKSSRLAVSRTVIGIDGSPEMISLARQTHPGSNPDYRVADMLSLPEHFSPGSFDAVICLGNTLAHLSEPGQVDELFRQVRVLLCEGGVLIGQIVNFDRVISQKVDHLPVIETDDLVFRRFYKWHGTAMIFRIELEDKSTGGIQTSETPMRPILKESLESALRSAGFGPIEFFGDFSGNPYADDCFHLIFKTAHVN